MQATEFRIRRAANSEAHLVALMAESFIEEIAPIRQTRLSATQYLAGSEAIISNSSCEIWVADRGSSDLVGFMTVNERYAIYSGGLFLEVTELYVDPEIRNYGIGAAFLEKIKMLCVDKKTNRVVLSTGVEDRTAKPNNFYRRFGFEYVGPHFRCLI